jgi:hypothetical protein
MKLTVLDLRTRLEELDDHLPVLIAGDSVDTPITTVLSTPHAVVLWPLEEGQAEDIMADAVRFYITDTSPYQVCATVYGVVGAVGPTTEELLVAEAVVGLLYEHIDEFISAWQDSRESASVFVEQLYARLGAL